VHIIVQLSEINRPSNPAWICTSINTKTKQNNKTK